MSVTACDTLAIAVRAIGHIRERFGITEALGVEILLIAYSWDERSGWALRIQRLPYITYADVSWDLDFASG